MKKAKFTGKRITALWLLICVLLFTAFAGGCGKSGSTALSPGTESVAAPADNTSQESPSASETEAPDTNDGSGTEDQSEGNAVLVLLEEEPEEEFPEEGPQDESSGEVQPEEKPPEELPEQLPEQQIDENGSYTSKEDVALYIHIYGKLPPNFITKKEAEKLGWRGGSLEEYAPGKCIGGSRFGNNEGRLPAGKYWECDIDTLGKKKRGAKRIIYSDDGRIYYTGDHYETFELLYGSEE